MASSEHRSSRSAGKVPVPVTKPRPSPRICLFIRSQDIRASKQCGLTVHRALGARQGSRGGSLEPAEGRPALPTHPRATGLWGGPLAGLRRQ